MARQWKTADKLASGKRLQNEHKIIMAQPDEEKGMGLHSDAQFGLDS